MKHRKLSVFFLCVLLNLIFTTGCTKEKEVEELVDVHVAHEKLVEEFLKTGNRFDQNRIVITEIGIVEESSTLYVGLLVLNRKIEKQFRAILENEILHGKVKLIVTQEEKAIAD